MSTPTNGGPAFPIDHQFVSPRASREELDAACGMSLRDWFAGLALEGWLASYAGSSAPHPGGTEYAEKMAVASYQIADAMLKARNQSSP